MNSSTETKTTAPKRLTREERLAQQREAREQNLRRFEVERGMVWLSLLSSAMRIVLAFHTYAGFSEEIGYNGRAYKDLRVDIEGESITLSPVGTVTRESLTYDQAENIKIQLEGLECSLKNFLDEQRYLKRAQTVLNEAYASALKKLTDVEKIALGLFEVQGGFTSSLHSRVCRNAEKLEESEHVIVKQELAKQ